MISLLCLAAATLVGNSPAISPIPHSEDSIVEFVSNNFSAFVSKYNETHEENLVATKLIRTREIALSDDVKGYYFDFDQGYMVATSDYDIRSISNFDLSFESDLFSTDSVYFSGTAFYDSNGVEYRTSDDEILTTKLGTPATTKSSPATNQNDGKITSDDIGSYISSNYSGYTIVDEKYIPYYDYIGQFDTSVYVKKNPDGGHSSEGNCVLNATYSMLHNMGKRYRNREFYFSDYYVDYSGDRLIHDAHYSSRNNANGWMPNTFKIEGTPNNNKVAIECMSDLYLRLRERAISSYGYNEEGMYLADVKNMAMDVDGWYGYDTTFRDTKNFDIVKEMVDDNIPLVVGTTGSITYDNHAMSVNGYIKMQKTSGWWIFTSTDTKWILAVDDGHQDSHSWGGEKQRRFYDPNKKGGADFVYADRNTIEYSFC